MRSIPGFRSRRPWKMAVAVVGYLVIATWLVMGLGGDLGSLLLGAWCAGAVVLGFNVGGLRRRIPLVGSPHGWVAWPSGVALGLVSLVLISQVVPRSPKTVSGPLTASAASQPTVVVVDATSQARVAAATTAAPPTSTTAPTPEPTATPTADELEAQVEADWSAGNWQRATSGLETLRRQSPDQARYTDPLYAAYIFWGDDSLAKGDRQGAVSHYNQAIALDPSRGEARDALTALTPTPTARPTQPPTATVLRPVVTATPIPLPPSSGSGSGGGGSSGCGSRGGPGYRLPNGKCASWR